MTGILLAYLPLQVFHLSAVTFLHLLQELQPRLQVLHQLPFHVSVSLCMARPGSIIDGPEQGLYRHISAHVQLPQLAATLSLCSESSVTAYYDN